jgi:hypothetical protein
MFLNLVILSGGAASRRETAAESKDPVPARSEMNVERNSHARRCVPRGEFPAAPVLQSANSGSFDCATTSLREVVCSAQDTRPHG